VNLPELAPPVVAFGANFLPRIPKEKLNGSGKNLL
jgi:hypothetical protein